MRIDISSYDLDNLKPIKNSRHKGNFGGCYLFGELVFKYFEKESDIFKKIPLEARLNELTKIKIDGVSLPINLVYCNEKMVGYTMPYYNGPTLSRLLLEFKLGKRSIKKAEIMNFYFSILNKIEKLSYCKIKVNDIKPDNIIYYNNEACLVDCDFYYIDSSMTRENILNFNIKLLNEAFLKVFENYFNEKKYSLNYKDSDLQDKDFINKFSSNL